VIVADAVARWPASNIWTAQGLSTYFGDCPVQVYDSLFELQTICLLDEYLRRYWSARPGAGSPVPYVRWYTKFRPIDFVWADEAFAALSAFWRTPYFLPSTDYILPACAPPKTIDPVRDAFPAKGLFISAAGACTRLHQDPWGSSAVLCQLHGSKRVALFSAGRRSELTAGGQLIDLTSIPETSSQHPTADFDDTLAAGEVLFIPAGWLHHVVSLTSSVSLTWNFVHGAAAAPFREFLSQKHSAADDEVLRYFSTL
jgi:hypothetical protein